MEAFVPQRFGPYQLLRRIGVGGMAEVFLAKAAGVAGFEKWLCIKRVLPEHLHDTEFIDLLVQEAKLVSRISHPNVAQVYDLGRVGEQYYLAMEWIDGVDALTLLKACEQREVHLPIPAAAFIVHEIARGLHAAHTQTDEEGRPLGIVHRDVTPTNVLVSFEGAVKLIDFGVARNVLRSRQTAVGVVKGKYNYLAPEQARGERVDARADVFAAGILLFELLAGEPLYPGTQAAEVIAKARAAKIPSLRKIRSEVPRELEAIMLRALARDRDARTPTAQALADELEQFLTANAPGYGGGQLAELLRYFFPDRAAAAAAGGPPSIVSMPGLELVQEPDEAAVEAALEGAPTRVASPAEVDARRQARAAGVAVEPVPVVLPPRAGSSTGGAAFAAAPPPAPSSSRAAAGRGRMVAFAFGALGALAVAGAAAFALSSRRPILRLVSSPAGASILVDGRPSGAVTPSELPLERGEHLVELSLPGHETHVERVALERDMALSIALRPTSASLEVVSEPPGALVRQDGRVLGTTPLSLAGLSVGTEIRLQIEAPGHATLVHVHRVTAPGPARVELRLAPEAAPGPPQGGIP